MTKQEAIKLFREIQNGRGTGDFRTKYLVAFGAGRVAEKIWNEPEFTLGVEYGILIALSKAFDIEPQGL